MAAADLIALNYVEELVPSRTTVLLRNGDAEHAGCARLLPEARVMPARRHELLNVGFEFRIEDASVLVMLSRVG